MIDELRRCGEGVAPEVGAMLEAYHGNVGRDRLGAYVHDDMAHAVLVWPELFDIRAASMTVVTVSGTGRGRTVDDFASAEPNTAVVMALAADRFLDRHFGFLRGLPTPAPPRD